MSPLRCAAVDMELHVLFGQECRFHWLRRTTALGFRMERSEIEESQFKIHH